MVRLYNNTGRDMNNLTRRVLAAVIGVVFALNVSGCATYKVHPEFKDRQKNIKSLAIMPAKIEAYMLTFQGDRKMLSELVPVMEKTTMEQMEKILSEKGYEIRKCDLSENTLSKKPDLRTALFHVNELFEKQLKDIEKNKKSKFTYGLGSEVNTFANLADSDILVFVKEDGIKKSAGEIAKDIAKGAVLTAACLLVGAVYIPIPQTAATVIHVAIVDGNDGDILWYNNNVLTPDVDPENQKQLASLIKSLLSPFPESLFKKADVKTRIAEDVKPAVITGVETKPVVASPVVR